MLEIGVQSLNVIQDDMPQVGFEMLKRAGFSCVDFSLNGYLKNTDIYKSKLNDFFGRSIDELENFFISHRTAAENIGIKINQMHMPYPIFVPNADSEINDYLANEVAVKSMYICSFLKCPYIVIHGFKLSHYLGSEEAEWRETEKFIDKIAPIAKELKIVICIENLYNSMGQHIIEGPCCDAKKAKYRIDKINEKYGAQVLGFCFDTGHGNLIGIDFEKFIVELGDCLKVLHIHDNDGIADLHQVPFTFTKTRENKPSTDWDSFIRGLKKINYTGVLNFETAPVLTAMPSELKEKTLAFIAEIGKYFSNNIVTL
ncbi:MAG: sugar phosphate isomerase/epimerase [Firmicutes bacterium]|nr:sugar phosphate isomerase/epimerase [Bacillota bacterium]